MISIKPLSNISIEAIHKSFQLAFADYVEPFDLSIEQLKHMIERRGFNPDLSFGAFHDNQLVSFTLNGIGNWNNKFTAYDTGTGTIKEFRKQGLASRIFKESLPILREHKVSQYLLEVISSNTTAYELYKKAGFKVLRELDYYISTKDKLIFTDKKLNQDFKLNEILNPNWDLLRSFWDFKPSWQNTIDSIQRKVEYFKILGIYNKDELAGYGVIEITTGDIPQLAIAKNFRKMGLATELLRKLLSYSIVETVKIINSEKGYEPFSKLAESINLSAGIGQYEMLLEL